MSQAPEIKYYFVAREVLSHSYLHFLPLLPRFQLDVMLAIYLCFPFNRK